MRSTSQPIRRGLSPEVAGLRLSPKEFDAIDYEDCVRGCRYELIQGVVAVRSIYNHAEGHLCEELNYLIHSYMERDPQGSIVDATARWYYLLLPESRLLPDRVIWTGLGRMPKPKRDVPSVVIEFVSRMHRAWPRHYAERRSTFLAAGVKEYWLIDRFRRLMRAYRPAVDGFTEVVVTPDRSYEPPLMPGFVVPLAMLVDEANECDDSEQYFGDILD